MENNKDNTDEAKVEGDKTEVTQDVSGAGLNPTADDPESDSLVQKDLSEALSSESEEVILDAPGEVGTDPSDDSAGNTDESVSNAPEGRFVDKAGRNCRAQAVL